MCRKFERSKSSFFFLKQIDLVIQFHGKFLTLFCALTLLAPLETRPDLCDSCFKAATKKLFNYRGRGLRLTTLESVADKVII